MRRQTPMRVLLVAPEIDPGGTEGGATHIRELLRHFQARGPTRLLARRGAQGPDIRGVASVPKRFPPRSPHRWAARVFPRALVHAVAFRPDVIYERCTSFGVGALLGSALRRPVVTKVLDQRISPLSLRLADRLVTTDPRLVEPSYRAKVHRVRWGVNTELFAPMTQRAARDALGIAADGPVLTYVGSFKRWHDVLTLVRAVDLLGRRSVRVLMVGDGPLRRPLIGLARKRGIRDQFLLPGAQPYPTIPTWMAAADVCLAPFDPQAHLPSRTLGFSLDPLKVLESMAVARPTITVDAANIRRLLEPEHHAVLVPPRDPARLAAAMGSLLDAPQRRREMGEAARVHVVARHTWAHHVRELEDIFEDIRR